MKAKDYVAIWNDFAKRRPLMSEVYEDVPQKEDKTSNELDWVWFLTNRMAREVREISEARHAKSPESAVAIMLELQQKWEAVCRKIDHRVCTPEAFGLYLEVVQQQDGIVELLRDGRKLMSQLIASQRTKPRGYRSGR